MVEFEIDNKLYLAYFVLSEDSKRNILRLCVKRGRPSKQEYQAAKIHARRLLAKKFFQEIMDKECWCQFPLHRRRILRDGSSRPGKLIEYELL